jgi:hypothetical protein
MIEMRVRKKQNVDLGEVANGQRGRGQAFGADCKAGQPDSNPRKENWICENRSVRIVMPKKLINTRCVPEPCGGYPGIAPLRRIWPSESWSNWTPAFANPFVPEVTSGERVNS